jgi:anti-sigma factor ChrR (cupin superfamily)
MSTPLYLISAFHALWKAARSNVWIILGKLTHPSNTTMSGHDSVSMLVRLDPGTDYPGHTHAGIEELHLLHGVLKVDDRTLYPGDFTHSEPGSVDHRVWSETGCTCFLLTSTEDALF